jgi:hypothetical protein
MSSYATEVLESQRETLLGHVIPNTEKQITETEDHLAMLRASLEESGYRVLAIDAALDQLASTQGPAR